MSTEQFYDALAQSYHTLYPDWRREASAQGESLDRLIGRWHHGGVDVADVACGIGTQVIGLASLGHRVVGSDTSARAVARAAGECAEVGVLAGFAVADMRTLPFADRCVDVVVCADNALPHLLADDDVLAALTEMRRVLRPGGTAVVTARDYDRLVVDRPSGTLPQVFESAGERVISLQLWAWRGRTDVYDLDHVQVHEHADGRVTTRHLETTYRAYTSATLAALASTAGLRDVEWHPAAETAFFQPVMTAHRPLPERRSGV